jgi:hypothetical protein
MVILKCTVDSLDIRKEASQVVTDAGRRSRECTYCTAKEPKV